MEGESRSRSGGERIDDWTVSSILGDLRQRRILAMLLERSQPTTVRDLCVHLAARKADVSPATVPESDRRSVRLDLEHRCLPQLEAAGWIERRVEGILVDEPPEVEAERLSLPDLTEPSHPSWDAVSVLLARPRRLHVVSTVAARDRPVTVSDLVAVLRTAEGASCEGSTDDDRSLLVALHHVDLPKLERVDLVDYDRDEAVVAPTARLSVFVDRTDLDTR